MTEKKGKRKAAGKWNRFFRVILALLLVTGMFTGTLTALGWERVYAADDRKLQNGSFEEEQTWTNSYQQLDQSKVPYWNTTAYNPTVIELLRENKSVYIPSVTVKPSDGYYAAELNADEESTLYQNVKTTPSSVYEWGLDHGARNGKDIMALVIGPKQSVDPFKPSKAGRDQLMQMVDWLNIGNDVTAGAEPKQYTVYSKKFAANGTFEDNAGNNAFSLTPSTIYTEEWHIWIMASSKSTVTSGTNPWNSYGSNAEGSAGSETGSGSTEVDLSKYYLYTVPAGQTETLFGFVSVGYVDSPTTADKAKTYGNFLDNINFDIYYPLTASSTAHGAGRVLVEETPICEVTGDKESGTKYVKEEKVIKLQAETADNKSYFVGVYYTEVDEKGTTLKKFKQYDSESGLWKETVGADGKKLYTYDSFNKMNAPIDIHFVFIQNPTITYDPNGGQMYYCDLNDSLSGNTYDFTPEDGEFKNPYISHAAEGYNGWKFMGWLLTGDGVTVGANGTIDESNLLAGEHSIACNYSTEAGSQPDPKQQFVVVNSKVEFSSVPGEKNQSVTWTPASTDASISTYTSKGLTLIAQWRWRQAFIPQVKEGEEYINSSSGGIVTIKDRESDTTNYDSSYEEVGKAYFAKTNDTVTVEAKEKEHYTFEGWYDSNGNLITTKRTYSYDVTKGSVNTYYARFSSQVPQTYIRQVKNGNAWEETTNDNIGTLGRYLYQGVIGDQISSTATAGEGYKFVGWYDSEGMLVDNAMLINEGATISYSVKAKATYYARFETAYTVKFAAQTKQANGSFQTDNVGGKVSVASVTDVDGAAANSKATANSGYKFLGWYDKDGKQLSTNATYSTTTTSATNGVTYYARFEIVYNPTVESQVYLSFVAESEKVGIPAEFSGRNAGTGINAEGYGLDNKFGNTISTGFKYSINTMTDVSTIQITVTVPDSAYVKVGGTGSFSGNGTPILTDSASVAYNKGSIQQISGAKTLTYYWDASGLQANTTYGFIIDNLYAPGATATITVNGTAGTKVTSSNGVVNTAAEAYRGNSHYPQ